MKLSNLPHWSGSTGSIIDGYWSRSAIFRLLKPRNNITLCRTNYPWQHDLNQTASGNPGAVQLIIDELGFVPLSKTGAELLFELISQRYERGSTLITSNLPFDEWTETFGSERLTGALLDRLTHHVNILEMNGESYRLGQSKARQETHKT